MKSNQSIQESFVTDLSNPGQRTEKAEEKSIWAFTSPIEVDFAGLQAINPEVVAWLYCEDTRIDYPVLHHSDDVFYLSKNIKRVSAVSGSIFLCSSNYSDFSDTHSILYGHRMTNGTMFGDLGLWEDPVYFEEHPFYLNTISSGNYLLKPIAIMETAYNSPLYTLDFAPGELEPWVQWLRSESLVDSSYVYSSGDRYISFSACSRHRNDTRLVLTCLMIPAN